jgi:hypothetical protein
MFPLSCCRAIGRLVSRVDDTTRRSEASTRRVERRCFLELGTCGAAYAFRT